MTFKAWALGLPALALAGCMIEPKELSGAFELRGNYKAVSDCVFLDLRKDGAAYWKKDDLLTEKRVIFTQIIQESTVGRIDVIGTSNNSSRLEVRFTNPGATAYFRNRLSSCQ
jgi:hypothetical protein